MVKTATNNEKEVVNKNPICFTRAIKGYLLSREIPFDQA